MRLRNAIKQSCDIYFYEVARLLGVDRLAITAKKYGLEEKVLSGYFFEEKSGVVPTTKWKLKNIGKRMGIGRNLTYRNWTGLYTMYSTRTLFSDRSDG